MRCHESHYSKEKYNNYKHKIKITDIPLYVEFNDKNTIKLNKLTTNITNWIYTGSLSKETSSADYACKVFSKIIDKGKSGNYKFDFYSRGNFESRIQEYSKKTSGAIIMSNVLYKLKACSPRRKLV